MLPETLAFSTLNPSLKREALCSVWTPQHLLPGREQRAAGGMCTVVSAQGVLEPNPPVGSYFPGKRHSLSFHLRLHGALKPRSRLTRKRLCLQQPADTAEGGPSEESLEPSPVPPVDVTRDPRLQDALEVVS